MSRPLIADEISAGTGPVVVISEVREEGAPILETTCAYRWRIRLEGTAEFQHVNSVAISCRLPESGVAIEDFAPRSADKPGAAVTFQAGGNPVIPISFGITMPRYFRTIEAGQRGRGHIAWKFFDVKLDDTLRVTLEGAFSVTFDNPGPHNLNMSVQADFFKPRFKIGKKRPVQQPNLDTLIAALEPKKSKAPVLRRKNEPHSTKSKVASAKQVANEKGKGERVKRGKSIGDKRK